MNASSDPDAGWTDAPQPTPNAVATPVEDRTAHTGAEVPAGSAPAAPLRAQHPRPQHLFVHISDTHFVGEGQLYGVVDEQAHLAELLARLEDAHARPEALVITGDLADAGDPAAYRRLRAVIDPVALRLGAQVIWVMGNHDDRAAVRSMLLDEEPSDAPLDTVHWFGGLRVVSLDSTVPGRHHGELTDAQLGWLAQQLATPAPEGTILTLHHPPVPCIVEVAVLVELQGQDRLAAVLRGSDVRSILAGHLHHSTSAMFAGIPVSVAAATCYTQDLAGPAGSLRTHDGGQAINLVHVYRDTVAHSVVPLGRFPTLSTVSAEQACAQLESAGIVWEPTSLPAFSHGAGMAK